MFALTFLKNVWWMVPKNVFFLFVFSRDQPKSNVATLLWLDITVLILVMQLQLNETLSSNKCLRPNNSTLQIYLSIYFFIFLKKQDVSYVTLLLLTLNCYSKLADSRLVVGIIIVGCAVHIPSSPIKLSSTLMIACYQQWTIAVIFKLRIAPGHYCSHSRGSNFLVLGAVQNLGT